MRLTSLPALTRREALVLLGALLLALAALWLVSGSIDRVGDGTPEPTMTPATASPPVVYEGEVTEHG